MAAWPFSQDEIPLLMFISCVKNKFRVPKACVNAEIARKRRRLAGGGGGDGLIIHESLWQELPKYVK